jgi:hypothetical protein
VIAPPWKGYTIAIPSSNEQFRYFTLCFLMLTWITWVLFEANVKGIKELNTWSVELAKCIGNSRAGSVTSAAQADPHIASVIAAVKPLRHPKSSARPLEDLSELVVPVGAKFHEELYGYFSRQSDRDFLVGVAGVHGDIDRRSGHSAVLDVSIGEFPVNVD